MNTYRVSNLKSRILIQNYDSNGYKLDVEIS